MDFNLPITIKKVYQEELVEFLPKNIIDCHTHVYRMEDKKPIKPGTPVYWPSRVALDNSIEDIVQTYKDLFPENNVVPVIFGMPSAMLDKNNAYISKVAKEYNYPALFCNHADDSAEFVEEQVIKGGFQGLKPYCNNQSVIAKGDAAIYDFLPESHLKVADKYGWKVTLHISKPDRLKNPDNIKTLMDIEQKYPNVKLIVAHIGRAYAQEDLGNAFKILSGTKNILFDFSANTNSEVITKCIETVGVNRIMFGTDLPIAKMKMKRIVENGNYVNIIPRGIYGDVSNDVHMRETDSKEITNFTYEIIRAFKRSCEDLSLSKKDIQDIMCNNACNLYKIKF